MAAPDCPTCGKPMRRVPGTGSIKMYACEDSGCTDRYFAGPKSIFGGK